MFLLPYGIDVYQNKSKQLHNNCIFLYFALSKLGAWSLFGMGEKWGKEVNPSVDH